MNTINPRKTIIASLMMFIGIGAYAYSSEVHNICSHNQPSDKVYYINTQKDFDKWSNTSFSAGSKVLFAVGKSFEGQFILRGSGEESAINFAGAYDMKTGEIFTEWTDNKPVINGLGEVDAVILLKNGSFWEINNLEVTNTNGSDAQQGQILGISIVAEDIGLAQNILVKNCYVHDVNGKVGGKKTGGIHVNVLGNKKVTKFHKVTIQDNYIYNVGGVGISNQSSYGNALSDNFQPWTEYIVRGNKVEKTGRNGIIVRYGIDPLVEYNIAAFNSLYSVGHSIFNFNTVGCVVQFNEAYGNVSDDPEEIDRGGFDCDFNSKNTIYQYNYSHDNHWFIAMQERSLNNGVIIRYNVSVNEKLGAYMYGFPEYDDLKDAQIYNNTHYFGEGKGTRMFIEAKKNRIPVETDFMNNIFYFEDKAEWGFIPDKTCTLTNNLFYNISPIGKNKIEADPMFLNPGESPRDIDMRNPNRLLQYRLKQGSPALNSGLVIENNGGKNFIGKPLDKEQVNIGAF